MKTEEEIRKRIEELQKQKRSWAISPTELYAISEKIDILMWALDELNI